MEIVVRTSHEAFNVSGYLRESSPELLPIYPNDHSSIIEVTTIEVMVDESYFDATEGLSVVLAATPAEINRLTNSQTAYSILVEYYKERNIFPLKNISHYVSFWRSLTSPELYDEEAEIHIPLLQKSKKSFFRFNIIANPVIGLGCPPIADE